ncbi:MAG: hypothetical protein WCQ96_03010 [Patescibacteria group bacterium]
MKLQKMIVLNNADKKRLHDWFFKWFVLSSKERNFWWSMQMMLEKYDYACFIEGRDLTFNEFITFYRGKEEDDNL